ncbi:hypothetical protein C8J57DRAFT_1093991 [Mycena rebaudengoi]|nr:hypothetical protein C8J57DRAFT_1093991 [Mycena rebaudengoi]
MGLSGAMQEDISTIFVVGFPEDMQEREFQNMFTFSPGFEAATLKIPNKEYTSYGMMLSGGAAPSSALPQQQQQQSSALQSPSSARYAGSNDPYNLLTVNQGGVVVDTGRDAISSWPAVAPSSSAAPASSSAAPTANSAVEDGGGPQHYMNGNPGNNPLPPRKQIIGFAKFRTREEALSARDVLQGRRVDIDRGAVLKAEMAKKNLHTKRGVGLGGGEGAIGRGEMGWKGGGDGDGWDGEDGGDGWRATHGGVAAGAH